MSDSIILTFGYFMLSTHRTVAVPNNFLMRITADHWRHPVAFSPLLHRNVAEPRIIGNSSLTQYDPDLSARDTRPSSSMPQKALIPWTEKLNHHSQKVSSFLTKTHQFLRTGIITLDLEAKSKYIAYIEGDDLFSLVTGYAQFA
jgi:type III secretory pathway component EscR